MTGPGSPDDGVGEDLLHRLVHAQCVQPPVALVVAREEQRLLFGVGIPDDARSEVPTEDIRVLQDVAGLGVQRSDVEDPVVLIRGIDEVAPVRRENRGHVVESAEGDLLLLAGGDPETVELVVTADPPAVVDPFAVRTDRRELVVEVVLREVLDLLGGDVHAIQIRDRVVERGEVNPLAIRPDVRELGAVERHLDPSDNPRFHHVGEKQRPALLEPPEKGDLRPVRSPAQVPADELVLTGQPHHVDEFARVPGSQVADDLAVPGGEQHDVVFRLPAVPREHRDDLAGR